MRMSPGPATRARTAFPAAWATSNQMPAETSATYEEPVAPGPSALHSHRSISQSNPNPHATPKTARARRWRRRERIHPAVRPTSPHPSICHGVHGPWPRNAFEASAADAPVAGPARAPRLVPATAVSTVTGWTFGTAANTTRPAAAAAASAAMSASSRLRFGPVSTATSASAPAETSVRATRLSNCGLHPVQLPGVDPPARQADGRLGRLGDEARVVTHDDDGRAARGQRPHDRRDLAPAPPVHAACRLVEHEEVGLHRGHRRDREPLALAAREVARVAAAGPGEAEAVELGCRPGRPLGRRDAEVAKAVLHLLRGGVVQQVAGRILGDIPGSPGARHRAAIEREEAAGGEGERGLAGAVGPGDGGDAPSGERGGHIVERIRVAQALAG